MSGRLLASVAVAFSAIAFCVSAQPTTAPTPLAWYRFNGDPTDNGLIRDEAGAGASVDFKNAPVTDSVLVCNGEYENGPEHGYRAVINVPKVDYNAFTVVWRF